MSPSGLFSMLGVSDPEVALLVSPEVSSRWDGFNARVCVNWGRLLPVEVPLSAEESSLGRKGG